MTQMLSPRIASHRPTHCHPSAAKQALSIVEGWRGKMRKENGFRNSTVTSDCCHCTHVSSTTGAISEGDVLGLLKHRMTKHSAGLTLQFAAEALLPATADYSCPTVLPLQLEIAMHLARASLSPPKRLLWNFSTRPAQISSYVCHYCWHSHAASLEIIVSTLYQAWIAGQAVCFVPSNWPCSSSQSHIMVSICVQPET